MADPPRPTPRTDPVTPQGFTLPTVGMDRDVWGDLTNANWSLADTLIADAYKHANDAGVAVDWLVGVIRSYVEPIGSIKIWPATAVPLGWASCDGLALSRTTYAELFAVVGTSWGAGDGSTTFNIPDMRGMVPVHFGDWVAFGSMVGQRMHTLTQAEMPAHSHQGTTDVQGEHVHQYISFSTAAGGFAPGFVAMAYGGAVSDTGASGAHGHSFGTGATGGGAPHNIVQPSCAFNFVIKCAHPF